MASKFIFRKLDLADGYSVDLRDGGRRIGYLYPAYSGRGWDPVLPGTAPLCPCSTRELAAEQLLERWRGVGGLG